jgi:hypothetical protein
VGLAVSFRQYPTSIPNVQFPDGLTSNNWHVGYYMDRFLDNYTLDIPIGEFSAYDLLNMQNPMGPVCVAIKGDKPKTTRAYNGGKDGARYGSAIGGLLSLGHATRSDHRTTWTKETDTVHLSARGSLQDDYSGRDHFPNRTIDARWNGVFNRYANLGPDAGRLYRQITFSRPNGVDTFTVPTSSSVTFADMRKRYRFAEFISEAQKAKLLKETKQDGYAVNLSVYHSFQILQENYSDQGGVFQYTYVFENTADSLIRVQGIFPHAFHKYQVTITLKWAFQPTGGLSSKIPGTYTIIDTTNSVERAYVLMESQTNRSIPGNYPWAYESANFHSNLVASPAHIISKPVFRSDNGGDWWKDKSGVLAGYPREEALHWFYNHVESIHGDIRSASALSANDALSSVKSDTNYLESLPELPSILKWGGKVAEVGKVVKDFSKGNPKAVSELVDLIASSYLLYKYGAKPLRSDIEESYRIARVYAREMDVLSKPLAGVFYGKFSYDIPGKVPRIAGRLNVMVRTKMVLRSSPGGVLAGIIALDEVGFLPTLGRIWDLVPFSFVIDWFTGLSNKFETIDSMAIRAALDVDYYVHTYTYRLFPDPSHYSPFRRRSATDVVEYRMFVRERSLHHPLILSDRYDFQPPAGVKKNLLAAGSLLWVSK